MYVDAEQSQTPTLNTPLKLGYRSVHATVIKTHSAHASRIAMQRR